jgi:hypothetical protein
MLLFFSGALGGPRLSPQCANASTFGNWGDEGDKRATGRAFVAKQLDGVLGDGACRVVCCDDSAVHTVITTCSTAVRARRVTTVTTTGLFKNRDESTRSAQLCGHRAPFAPSETGDGVSVCW